MSWIWIAGYVISSMVVISYILFKVATDHSHVANVQCKLVTPAFVSPAPHASSPSPDTNEGTYLQVFEASDCSTLQLLQVDKMEKGESKEF